MKGIIVLKNIYNLNYYSAILFGIRKQNLAERGKEELFKKLDNLKKIKEELSNRVILLYNN